MLLAGEPFFLRGGKDLPIAHQARGAVVIEGREAEDVHARHITKVQFSGHEN